jgi:hypothetical protein
MSPKNGRLVAVVTASYKGAVGYGYVFQCRVSRVVSGALDEPTISLCILPSDKDDLQFIMDHVSPAEIEIGFRVHRKNEPYGLAPISGFVDKKKTSWRIAFIREPED